MTHRPSKSWSNVTPTRKPETRRLRRDLEPDAGAGPLAKEAPAFRERVDQLETAPVLVVPAGHAPVRQADAPVVDDAHVHDRAETHHGHRHPGRVGGVPYRVGHQLTGQQLGVAAARMVGQHIPDEPPGRRHLLRAPREGPRRARGRRAPRPSRGGDSKGRTGHISLRDRSNYCPSLQCNSRLTIVHSIAKPATPDSQKLRIYEFWLRVVCVPEIVTITPCWVTLTLWIDTPAGSFGMEKLKLARFPSRSDGIQPASMTLTLIVFGPVWVTCASAVSLSGPMLIVALTLFPPSEVSWMPCGMPPTLASAVNVTSAEALNWSTVALLLLNPWKCRPCSVALRLAISRAPLPALGELIVSLRAEMLTVMKSLASSWVQNGNPWMLTVGLPDRFRDDWTWLAIWFSANALATRSLTTSSTKSTITVIRAMSGPLRRRLRVTKIGGSGGGCCHCGCCCGGCCHCGCCCCCCCRHSGRGRVGSALMTGLPAWWLPSPHPHDAYPRGSLSQPWPCR